jgi:hypothetical protein
MHTSPSLELGFSLCFIDVIELLAGFLAKCGHFGFINGSLYC